MGPDRDRNRSRGSVLMLRGHAGDTCFAARIAGKPEPWAVNFWLQPSRPFGHFAILARAIDEMFVTGKSTFPVARTLLTTGILDAAMTSRFQKNQRLKAPHLAIAYAPGPRWKPPLAPRTGPPVPSPFLPGREIYPEGS